MADIDEEGGIGMNNFANFKDDGSLNSKDRLELLKRMYFQNLEEYRESLEDQHSREKDTAHKEQVIEQELAIYEATLWNRFFPEIMELEKKIAQEERKTKGKPIPKKEESTGKKDDEKKDDEKDTKKDDEKKADEKKTPEAETPADSKNQNQATNAPKQKTKSQQVIEQFDKELKQEGINFDKFKEKDDFDLDSMQDSEKQELSSLCFRGMRHSIDKSEADKNPGWLCIYLKSIYPTLAQILPPSTLFELSQMIMSGYLTKNYGLQYADIPPKYEDLRSNPKYKDQPPAKRMLLAEGIVAREMSFGHVTKQNSAPAVLTQILDSVPFDSMQKNLGEEPDISTEFNQAVRRPPKAKTEEAPKPKGEVGSMYYQHDETIHVIPEEQITEFGQFLHYTRTNKFLGYSAEKQISKFDEKFPRKNAPMLPLDEVTKPSAEPSTITTAVEPTAKKEG